MGSDDTDQPNEKRLTAEHYVSMCEEGKLNILEGRQQMGFMQIGNKDV